MLTCTHIPILLSYIDDGNNNSNNNPIYIFLPKKVKFFFNFLFQTGHTALQRAAAEGHLEIVKTLLENGVSVDHQDEVVSIN